MRLLDLALLTLLSGLTAAAAAQEPMVVANDASALDVPEWLRSGEVIQDTISPWRWYPLAVGNAWEYSSQDGQVMRIDIRRDSVINGHTYYNWHRMWYAASGEPQPWSAINEYIRFDTTSSSIRPGFPWIPCPFDGQPGEIIECPGAGNGMVTFMTYDGILVFSDTTITDVPVKEYDTIGGIYRYGADFGEVWGWRKDGFPARGLTFARIDGREFGTELFPLSDHGPPLSPSGSGEITLWPNPTTGILYVRLAMPAPGPLRLTIYDMLGRLVFTEHAFVSGTQSYLELDVSAFSLGHYTVYVLSDRRVLSRSFVIM